MANIERDVKLVVNGKTAKFDEQIYIFRGDRDIQLNITIVETKMKFNRNDTAGNVLAPLPKDCYARVGIRKPKGEQVVRDRVPIEDDVVKFVIDSTICDELDEVGMHKIQIQIYALDDDSSPRWTLPSAAELEVLKPDVDFDGIAAVAGEAKAGISLLSVEGDSSIVTFNEDGSYNQTIWKNGDVITVAKLNKIEEGIEGVNQKVADLFQSVSNGKTLIASAITDKGVTTSNIATFQTMANNIRAIPSSSEVVTYTVTNNLTNCSTDNDVATVIANNSYSATITADDGYALDTVTVTMGNDDITSTSVSDGVITIDSVTGNIVITASATEQVESLWTFNRSLDSNTGAEKSHTGDAITSFIPVSSDNNYVLHNGVEASTTRIFYYDADQAFIACTDRIADNSDYDFTEEVETNNAVYIRLRVNYATHGYDAAYLTENVYITETSKYVELSWVFGKVINKTGGGITDDGDYFYADFIAVNPGDVVTLNADTSTYGAIRICTYNSSQNFVSSGEEIIKCTESIYSATYTVEDGVYYIRLRSYSNRGLTSQQAFAEGLKVTLTPSGVQPGEDDSVAVLAYNFDNDTPGNGYGTITISVEDEASAGTYTIKYADVNGELTNYDSICTLSPTVASSATYSSFHKDQMIPKYATKIIAVKNETVITEFEIPEAKRFTSGNYGQHLYSFGAISDIHTGADTWDTDLQEAFTYLNEKESVIFTCASGDITDNGTQTQFENFKSIKDTYSPDTPFYATNGNHEWYNSGFSDSFWRTYIDNDRTCLFTQGNDVFIMFGNQGTGSNCFTDEQKTWLETQLARYANCRVFVFNHYFINGTDNGNFNNYYGVNVLTTSNTQGQWMLGLLQRYPNMFYVTGHSHMKFIVQELCNTITIRNDWSGSETGYMVHLPSITNPRDVINGSFTGKLAAQSEGVVIDVYENCVLYRGRNFVDKKFIPIGQYLLPKAQGTLPSENDYVVTKTLNNSTSSNTATSVEKNSSYTTTITPNDGYVINKITVLMGGTDVTSTVLSDNVITIDSVTGDVSVSVKTIAVTDKDNVIWTNVDLDSTTGAETTGNYVTSQYIAYNSAHTYTLFAAKGTHYSTRIFFYDTNQAFISRTSQIGDVAPKDGNYLANDYCLALTIPENTAYIRIRPYKDGNGFSINTSTASNYFKLLTEEDMVNITGLTLSATELVFNTQDTQTLTATKVPSNATVNISYSSNSSSIARVNGAGVVTPVDNGECVITATAGGLSATCNVTVSCYAHCTGVTLDQTTLALNGTNNTATLVATVAPEGCTDSLSWTTNNDGVATVNNGVVTAVANGTATITATCGSYSASCEVTVSGMANKVSTNLYQVTSSNSATACRDGEAYSTTLAAVDGCSINHVRITMGGEDVTDTVYNTDTGEVNIANVTADVVINALGVTSAQTVCDIATSNFIVRAGNCTATDNEDGSITITFSEGGQQFYVTHNNMPASASVVLYVEDVSYSLELTETLKRGLGFRYNKIYTMTTGVQLDDADVSGRIQFNDSKSAYANIGGTHPVSITFRNCKLIVS